jgi:hypothetical protein
VVRAVFRSMTPASFRKSIELDVIPGVMADVYMVRCGDDDWYVKFYLDPGSGCPTCVVLSCNFDGFIH